MELRLSGGNRVSDKEQGNFVWAILAGAALDVAIELIKEFAYHLRTTKWSDLDYPFRYGLIGWQDSLFKTAAIVSLPLLVIFLDWIVRTRAAGHERIVFYTTLILSVFTWKPLQ
jgi:hypothetical protein